MNIEELLQKGIGLAGKGLLREAMSVFEQILDAHPCEPRALYNSAVVQDMMGRRDNALALLRRSMDADPSFANPYHYLGQLYLQAGSYAEAYKSFRAAIARDVEFSAAYEGIRKASVALGRDTLEDQTDADVVFYTGGPPFHGKTLEKTGLGGSESALIYVARALAEHGKRVRVFCNCDCPGTYNGVRYDELVDFHIYRKQRQFPAFISSRSMRPFKIALQARLRILWIHDDINVAFLKDDNPRDLPIDRIFTISQWQREEWARHFGIPHEKFYLTRNGVDLTVFKPGDGRERHRLIYVSRPNRGLEVLLELFPDIRQRVPDAELHLYTYFVPGDEMDGAIMQKARQPGVFIRGSLPKAALAVEIAASRLMVYPATFRETSCIAAIESQAAGTPVVASALAALPETVIDGVSGCLVPGDPRTAEFKSKFVEKVVSLLRDDVAWQRLSQGARLRCESFYNWQIIAREWLSELRC